MKHQILNLINSDAYRQISQPIQNQETNEVENLIVRYIYNETSTKENEYIKKLLSENSILQQFFYDVAHLKKQLDTCQTRFAPSNDVLERIMNYAKR